MTETKRTTVNLPKDLLEGAQRVAGESITETIILGLKLVKRTGAYSKAQALRGKLDLKIDIDVSRERNRR
ncbi:MAG: hypothetical protein ACR2NN_03550 [Bryobacteraceae bacterium]